MKSSQFAVTPPTLAMQHIRNIDFFDIRIFDLIHLPTRTARSQPCVGAAEGIQGGWSCVSCGANSCRFEPSAGREATGKAAVVRFKLREWPAPHRCSGVDPDCPDVGR